MKNLYLLDTDKPSRLFYLGSNLHLEQGQLISPKNYQNIYITSDEEIKLNDYFIESLGLPDSYLVHKLSKEWKDKESFYRRCAKVILTTDVDLIADGVQSIDDEFLEWFVKNPSCEFVKVIPDRMAPMYYDIVIPKEEPQQETLEEAAENYAKQFDYAEDSSPQLDFIEGAKWMQERSYSEEEVGELVYNIIGQYGYHYGIMIDGAKLNELFEQFKKK